MIAIPIREGGMEVDTLYILQAHSFPELRPDWLANLSRKRAIACYRRWLWEAINRADYFVVTAVEELRELRRHGRLDIEGDDPAMEVLIRCLDWLLVSGHIL